MGSALRIRSFAVDQPRIEPVAGTAEISLTPDMRLGAKAEPQNQPAEPASRQRKPSRGSISGRIGIALGLMGVLIGLGAVGATSWLQMQTQQEILRLSTELAQLRISLDLYARNAIAAAPPAPAAEPEPAAVTGALPEIAPPGADTPTAASAEAAPAATDNQDCLPAGMRLLVAAGDSYAVCGQTASVDVATVDNGYVMLKDGTTVPSGGTMPLLGSACTIGVTSSGDEGLTGYAEIRVTC